MNNAMEFITFAKVNNVANMCFLNHVKKSQTTHKFPLRPLDFYE